MTALTAPRPATAPALPAAALRADEVWKQFGDVAVLHGVHFHAAPGEIVAIVGRSGCGKSTLLRILAGLEEATSGRVRAEGQPLRGLNRAARLMFQDALLLPWRTVEENVALAAPGGPAAARSALEQVGLGDRGGEWPAVLSGGQRQRVALARALASEATTLLLDEPFGALDALTRLEMHALLERVWSERAFAAVLVTHDVDEAVALADRVLVMEGGRFVLEESVPLPRPRRRSDPDFTARRDRILARVLRAEAG